MLIVALINSVFHMSPQVTDPDYYDINCNIRETALEIKGKLKVYLSKM